MTNRMSTLLLAVFAIAGCASAPEAPPSAPAPVAAPAPRPAAPTAAPAPKPGAAKVSSAAEALFDFDRAVIRPDARSKLDELVGKTRGVTLEVIIAIGHADAIGSDAYNMKLSLRRADAAKAYLVSKAVPASRIYTEGKGKRQPIADNKTSEGRQKNRRVEVEAVGTR